ALQTAMFARPAFGHYYFGNYFGPGFSQAGFVPWTDYSVVKGAPDPLFAAQRAHHGSDWGQNLRKVYAERLAGNLPPPPTNLRQQEQVIQHLSKGAAGAGTVEVNQKQYMVGDRQALARQLTVVAPLTQLSKMHPQSKLQPVKQ